MNIDDMNIEQLAKYAADMAAESEWRRLVAAVERGGTQLALEALSAEGEWGVWNTYGGSSHLHEMAMTIVCGGVRLTAASDGQEFAATLPIRIPAGIWQRG